MPWTRESKLDALLRLPWTVRTERSDEGYLVARCAELPGTLATGSETEIDTEFWDSMRATMACLLDFNDAIPLPAGVKFLPWEQPAPPRRVQVNVRASRVVNVLTAGSGTFSREAAPA
jgi:hypothetical protein